jgi:rhomboid protease GluP
MARAPRILDEPVPGGTPPDPQPPAPQQMRQRWPVVCCTVLVGSVLMFILGRNHLLPPLSQAPEGMELAAIGIPLAIYGPLVEQGEYWRLLSCVFEHGDIVHLFLNMSVLYSLGFMLERAIGSWRFLGLSFVTALGASAFSLLFNFDVPTVGASGMILGWAGAMLPIANEQGRRELGFWLVLIALISVLPLFSDKMPKVSWAGHLGGFLFGLPCGVALRLGRAVYSVALPLILFISAVVATLAAHPKWR